MECGRAGLCGGKLRGPSILLDIIEFRLLFELESAESTIVPFVAGRPTSDIVIGFIELMPGVLDVERCVFGEDGTLFMMFLVYKENDDN